MYKKSKKQNHEKKHIFLHTKQDMLDGENDAEISDVLCRCCVKKKQIKDKFVKLCRTKKQKIFKQV
jgi:hypothetical protein